MSKRSPALPDGFVITREDFGGTGHGDERFRFALDRWQPHTRGIFRKKTSWKWTRVAHSSDDSDTSRVHLIETARLLEKTEPVL